jgi:hypothetical protein
MEMSNFRRPRIAIELGLVKYQLPIMTQALLSSSYTKFCSSNSTV